MHNLDYSKILEHVPDELRDKCKEAFREGLQQTQELTEEEVRVDEAQKAEDDYNRIHHNRE